MSDTITIPRWLARLAAEYLSDYGDRLGNDECNDYDLPAWVPADEIKAALRALNPEDAGHLLKINWAVVGVVAHLLKRTEPMNERPANTDPVITKTVRTFNPDVVTVTQHCGEPTVWLHHPGERGGQVLTSSDSAEEKAEYLRHWLRDHLIAAGVQVDQ